MTLFPECAVQLEEGYACGKAVLLRDPHARREDGCPGGLFVCGSCVDGVVEFLDKAHDARARRKEWESD